MKITILFSLFFGLQLHADELKTYRSYVSIQGLAEGVSVEVTLPNEKESRLVNIGEAIELSSSQRQGDKFPLTIQMVKSGLSFMPCQISVEKLPEFDRVYVCTAQDASAQAQVRVYTNMHGGDRRQTPQIAAR